METILSLDRYCSDDEKCSMLYTDSMGKVLNVIISGETERLAKS